jgi:hypothetical protein
MARIRGIKPDFFKDEDLCCLPFEARIFFEGLWCYADREGRLEDRPKYLKAEIFPYDDVDVEKLLQLLADPKLPDRPGKRFIRRYIIDERKYIDIPEFLKHQNPHNTERQSVLPEFNGEITVNTPCLNGSLTVREREDTVKRINRNRNNKESINTLSSPSSPPFCPHAEIVAAYNDILGHCLPKVKIQYWQNSTGAKNLAARWKQTEKHQSIDYWKGLFEYIRDKCSFLMGENDRGWTADLRWIVKGDHFIGIVEGKYAK